MKVVIYIATVVGALLQIQADAANNSQLKKALCPFSKKQAVKLMSAGLLHESTIEELEQIFLEKEALYGKCKKMEKDGSEWLLHTNEAILPLDLKLSSKGKIEDFSFGPPEISNDSMEKVQKTANRAFPLFSYYIDEEGKERASLEKQKPLNIGHTSQLFLLRALKKRVDQGSLKLDTAVPLEERLTQLSYGPIRQWPPGTLVSLDALKSLMVIDLDTAAADHLIQLVGREKVAEEVPGLKHYLFFHEYNALLAGIEPQDLPPRDRASELPALAAKVIEKAKQKETIAGSPKASERLGWFTGTESLCQALRELKEEKTLRRTHASEGTQIRLNEAWKNVISVQTRDSGIAQSTILATSRVSGKSFCLAMTANGQEEISEATFGDLTDRILSLILAEKMGAN